MSVVKVLVGGQIFGNYEQMRIFSDLYSLADTFSFSGVIPANLGGKQIASPTVKCGQNCKISIDGKIVMSGYIMDTRLSIGERGTSFDFSGIDICGYLSTLSVADIVEWKSCTAQEIINELKKQIPFMANVNITGLNTLGILENIMISTGQQVSTVFNMICDKTNSIFYALPNGTIKFGKKVRAGAFYKIIVGKDNVKQVTLKKSIQDVYDKIVYKCENENGTIIEQTVKVSRVPILGRTDYARVSAEPIELLGLAQKQANDALSKYMQLSVEYAGFADSTGKVWEINKGVVFSDLTKSGLENGSFVVEGVEFSDSRNEGQVAMIKMALPAIF